MSKVVIAHYSSESIFKIPKGLDLEDETQVKGWFVKSHQLFIELTDGTDLTIDTYGGYCVDYKWPNVTEIGLADDHINVSDDEEDDDEEEDERVVIGGVCKTCNNVLPPHTVAEHLDVTSKVLECPHVVEEDTGVVCETCDWGNGGSWGDHPVNFCKWACDKCGVILLEEEEEKDEAVIGMTEAEKITYFVAEWDKRGYRVE